MTAKDKSAPVLRGGIRKTANPPYVATYGYIMPYGLEKFKRFAVNVWNVQPNGKTDEEVALDGLTEMENWMKEIGLVMNITDLGVTEDMIDGITEGTFVMDGGYKVLTKDEIKSILKESMR